TCALPISICRPSHPFPDRPLAPPRRLQRPGLSPEWGHLAAQVVAAAQTALGEGLALRTAYWPLSPLSAPAGPPSTSSRLGTGSGELSNLPWPSPTCSWLKLLRWPSPKLLWRAPQNCSHRTWPARR